MAGKWQEIPIYSRNVSFFKFDGNILHYKAKSLEFPKIGRLAGVKRNVKKYQNFTFRPKEGRKRLNKAKKWRYTGGRF